MSEKEKSERKDKVAAGQKQSATGKPAALAAPDERETEGADHCVVAGVGASAGGLSAYKRLLQNMPDDSGIAFVLVQHLDPNHESMMVELLSKYTTMPVLQIEDAVPIRPDHVYMIPPNKFVRIKNDALLLDEPVVRRGVRLPIDYFFESLAKERRERAICVVLSGTGSDGTIGLREVKAAGGVTIVERPESAEYDGMPRSAMASGAVDFVVPIEEMADVIVPYARHPYVQATPKSNLADTAPNHFSAILNVLRAHTGLDFAHYKTGTLTRRIQRRMGVRRLQQAAEYLSLLRTDRDEVEALFQDMLIGVTGFFRNRESWEQLRVVLERRLLSRRNSDPLRVWVPGCATGEEAYSLAILMFEIQERQNKRFNLQIFATDVDKDAIDIARQGLYPESITKDVPEDLLDKYFNRDGHKLRMKKHLRESCVFAVQNLLSDPPFSSLDMVSCRNVLIYLDPEMQRRVFDMLHFALKEDGLLFLGSSESPAKSKELFTKISQADRIYEKRGVSRASAGHFPMDAVGGSDDIARMQSADARRNVVLSAAELSRRALLEAFAPASVVVDRSGVIQFIHGPVRDYMDFPSGEPELELGGMVFEGLQAKTRTALSRVYSGEPSTSLLAPHVKRNGGHVAVRVRAEALPRPKATEHLYLVSFSDEPDKAPAPPAAEQEAGDRPEVTRSRESQLALELQATREDLQSTIEELESSNEELKASNEEVMSMNEELQSTNEELETSREELQSLNEELSTVNNQLHDKVDELEATTNDLSNLLTSTDMATLFLDANLRIRSFTPATVRLMHLLDTDVGRPLSDLAPRVRDPELEADAERVLRDLTPVQQEVDDGHATYMRRITPFRTADNKIEGVVVTYGDVTELKKTSIQLELRERQQATVARLGGWALAGLDADRLADRAVHEVARTMDVELVKVLRLEPARHEFVLVAGVGWEPGLVGEARITADTGSQAGYTLRSGHPVVCEDLNREQRFSGPALLTDHGVRSGVSVIIGPKDEPWGVLGAHSRHTHSFSADDVNFMMSVANMLWDAQRRDAIAAELRAGEERTAAFLNNSAVLGWMKDERGRYIFMSETYRQRFDFVPDDWMGKTDRDFWSPATADVFLANDRKVFEAGEGIEVLETAEDANGKPWHFLVSKFPFTDAQGKRFVGGLAVDVTERVAAERALAESEERLTLAARLAGFGTYHVDVQADRVTWSEQFMAIVGMDPDAPVEVHVGEIPEFVHPDDRERLAGKIEACLNPAGDGLIRDEHRIVRSDGEVRWLMMQGRTLFSGKGKRRKPVRVAGIVLDITERHEFEAELREARRQAEAANAAKSEFLANMSHELRTPLTAILGFADVLRHTLADPDDLTSLDTIRENGRHLCDILDDVLDLARIEAGKLQLHSEDVDLIELLDGIRAVFEVGAAQKGLGFSLEAAGPIPKSIRIDGKMMRQVLFNLVGNAVKFTEKGSIRIRLSCDSAQEKLQVEVVDTGVGIAKKDRDRLFLAFEQLDGTAGRSVGGAGLGLSITRKLVQVMDGDIQVHSKPGKGSSFTVTVPTGPLDEVEWLSDVGVFAASSERHETEELPVLTGRVLAVDDRREIRFLVKEFLETAGVEVVTAADGPRAIAQWREEKDGGRPFDLVLMDIQMPGMDGLETTRVLRREGYRGPIIALTASAMQAERQACMDAGCNEVLRKPIDRTILVRTLGSSLQKPSSRPAPPDKGLDVLCVEDHADTRKLQKLILEQDGHRVVSVGSGADALAQIEDFKPQVALIDLGLGDMSGDELLQRLREAPGMKDCVFICISGRDANEVHWQDMGFHHFLQKPAHIDEIRRIVSGLRAPGSGSVGDK